MHAPQGRSALIAGILVATAAVVALAGGQGRDASRGQDGGEPAIPPTFGAKVVTEHVPVLPHLLRTFRKDPPEKDVVARMGFRSVPGKKPTEPKAAPLKALSQEAAPPKPPPPPSDPWFLAGRARLAAADYEGAIAPLSRSAKESKEDGDALLVLALAFAARAEDERAARSLRTAIGREPGLLDRTVDPASRFRDAAEFDRVIGELTKRAAAVPGNADAKFTLAVIRLLEDDERCRVTFAWLRRVTPEDDAVRLCRVAAAGRFPEKKTVKSPAPERDRREGVEK